jgi:hypothetical protein
MTEFKKGVASGVPEEPGPSKELGATGEATKVG